MTRPHASRPVDRIRASARARALLLGAAVASALVVAPAPLAAQSAPEPVRIGVLDLKADSMTYRDDGVKVVYREFRTDGYGPGREETASGHDHGQVVLTAVVREMRRMEPDAPVEVYAANAFAEVRSKDGSTGVSLNFVQAANALRWMREAGVRVVATAFNTRKEADSRALMDVAEGLGMTVFAGASNDRGAGRVFPAADPRSVSVADTTPGKSSLTLDPSVHDWVSFGVRGEVSNSRDGKDVVDWGSSYASAKAAAYGAYYAWRNPGADRAEIVDALRRNSREDRCQAGSKQVAVRTLGWAGMPESFRAYAGAAAARASRPATTVAVAAVVAGDGRDLAALMAARSRGGASR